MLLLLLLFAVAIVMIISTFIFHVFNEYITAVSQLNCHSF